jgi:hypothetical protein
MWQDPRRMPLATDDDMAKLTRKLLIPRKTVGTVGLGASFFRSQIGKQVTPASAGWTWLVRQSTSKPIYNINRIQGHL